MSDQVTKREHSDYLGKKRRYSSLGFFISLVLVLAGKELKKNLTVKVLENYQSHFYKNYNSHCFLWAK